MIPMIDVVFLLIIFFLVSNHIGQNEAQLPLELSDAISGEDDPNLNTPRVTINVRENGEMLMAGRVVAVSQLADRLRKVKQRHGDKTEVRIRCSRSAPYQSVEPIMLACTQSGIWNVAFAVVRKEGS